MKTFTTIFVSSIITLVVVLTSVAIASGPVKHLRGASYLAPGGNFTQSMLGPDGALGTPTFSFSSDSTNGLYLSGTDTLGLQTNSFVRMTIGNSYIIAYRDMLLSSGKKLYTWDSGGGEYLFSPSDGLVRVFAGGNQIIEASASSDLSLTPQNGVLRIGKETDLVDNVATDIFRVAVADTEHAHGMLFVSIHVENGTDVQSYQQTLSWTAAAAGGSVDCDVVSANATDAYSETSAPSTLTVGDSCNDNGDNTVDFMITANTSLGSLTSFEAEWYVQVVENYTITAL